LSVFVDSSAWYAAAVTRDRWNVRAKAVLGGSGPFVTTDHVLVESWLLLNARQGRRAAERFWGALRRGVAEIEMVEARDLEAAWAIGEAFPDQSFSMVDRTSFAVMRRLGLSRVASFDDDFAIFRYGPARQLAFEVLR
jgi:predicted nucleic acid-binding protein